MPNDEPHGLDRIDLEQKAVQAFDADRDLPDGALSPRTRITNLVDPKTTASDGFVELAARSKSQREELDDTSYGDGIVAGFGPISGRMTAVLSDDPISMAGSDGAVGRNKRARLLMQALHGCIPIVYFAQAGSGGGEAPEEGGLLGRYSDMSRVMPEVQLGERFAPLITVLCGDVAPEMERLVLESDLVIATPGASAPASVDLHVDTDAEALNTVAGLLKLIPDGTDERLQRLDADIHDPTSPIPDEGASDLAPQELIEGLCDADSVIAISGDSPDFAAGLASLAGYPVAFAVGGGDVLTQPQLDTLSRIVGLASRFQMPLLLGQHGAAYDDVALADPAYRRAVTEIGALIHDSEAPKLSVISKRGQGYGDFILGGRELGVHYLVAWPDAEVSTSEESPYTATSAGASDPDPWIASGLGLVDDVLAPSNTRDRFALMLDILAATRAFPPLHHDRRGRVLHR